VFNLDSVRVPQKYPGKRHAHGPKKGAYSGNPLGKNPGDVWAIPNVKHNHIEKTIHPCQFPVELVERLVLALTKADDWVLDPYMGVASTAVAAVRNERRAAGAEVVGTYFNVGLERIKAARDGTLRVRPKERPIYEPSQNSKLLTRDDILPFPIEDASSVAEQPQSPSLELGGRRLGS
jgi:adenine-specific DNA-methyltransferase